MIDIGAEYQLEFGSNEEKHYIYGFAKEYNHPLLLLKEHAGGKETIFNLGSSALIKVTKR